MSDLLLAFEVYAIVGAAYEVHNELGTGYLEAVYQEGLEIEFGLRGIPFRPQCDLEIRYKGQPMKKRYCADFVCYRAVIVEIKAIDKLTNREESQLLNYLKATSYRVGVLINFGGGKVEWRRFVR